MTVDREEGLPYKRLKPAGNPEYTFSTDCNVSDYSIIYLMTSLSNHLNSYLTQYITSMKYQGNSNTQIMSF